MNAGELRHRISIDSPTHTRSPGGSAVTTWTNQLHTWAAIRPASAREAALLGAVVAMGTFVITTRYSPSYLPKSGDRIRKGSTDRYFLIGGVVNVDERNIELRIMCSENGGA